MPGREHAEQVGIVSLLWSKLELYTDVFLVRIMDIEDTATASVVITAMSFRAKLNALRVLGFDKRPDETWFSELQDVINEIDNDLRPDRNRYIHDYWLASSEKVMHVQHKPRLVREQARKLAIQFHSSRETTVGELTVFQVKVLACTGHFMDLLSRYNRYKPDELADEKQ